MRTTIDLPDDLFCEVKTQAVRQRTTLKRLMTEYIRSGLKGRPIDSPADPPRRNPPPVAIHRVAGSSVQARTGRQLNELLEEEEIHGRRIQNSTSKSES